MDGQPSLRASPQRWWLMALLSVAMIFCYVHRAALSVAAPFMIEELGISKAVMGVLLSAFFWSYCLMQMPAGWVVDRFGVRRAYAAGYAFWAIASAVTGFARSLLVLIVLRMALGVGQAVAFPASARAVANWFQDKERGMVTGIYLAGVRLGTALVSAAGPFVLVTYGLKVFFLTMGSVSFLWLGPWHFFVKRWEDEPAVAPSGGTGRKPNLSFVQGLALMRNRTVFGIFLGFFAYDYAWFVYLNWLPGYLRMERNFSAQDMAIYSAAPYVAMSVIILLSGVVSDGLIRHGWAETRVRKTFIVLGLALCCLIVPAGLVDDKMTAVWLLTISLCGLGVATPNTWTLTQAVCSKNIVGTVSGIQNFGGNLGGVLAPVLTGYIAHASGSFALALAITGAICVVGIFSYVLLISQRVER